MSLTISYRVYFRYVGAPLTEWESFGGYHHNYDRAKAAAEELKSDPQIAEVDIIDKDVS